ncbi:MAG: gamma-glutamyl hercynylcysteine S-oxide synthase [Actinomycetota bacterium]|nr:gamma-glutamyl hercynylcysteine S-oxide synthase [Actinomycetota bacterium]
MSGVHLENGDLRQRLADELEAVRQRSLDLLSPLDDDALFRQHSPLMSPLVWDLAHVGNYEELWLLREVAGAAPIDAALDDVYDAFRHPRAGRPSLPLLGPAESRRYLVDVRGRALDALEKAVLDGDGDGRALLAGGFVYGMVVQHEHQHDETMLATLQLMAGAGYRPLAPPPPAAVDPPPSGEVYVPAGPFVMGTDREPFAYDNERPAHVVDLPAFRIDAGPVTNGRYLEFVLDGGYDRPELWEAEGWTWRVDNDVRHPQFWVREGRDWTRDRYGFHEDLPLDEPVQHVCWYEADAFALWAGKRLPTEAEWEKAASWTPDGVKRRFPWGDDEPTAAVANLGGGLYRPAPVGAYPAGASAYGCHQMIGDVWEWTASDFEPYPGFASFPYREYSEVFFGPDYKVLRGGSWATSPAAVRNTFRNWDYPIRRQIFSGFRCARSG